MRQPRFTRTQEYTYDGVAALLLIKTEPGMAPEVAEQVARMNEEEPFEGGYVVWGVRWTAILRADERSEGIADVLANVRVRSDIELEDLIARILDEVTGVVNPTPLTVDGYFTALHGHNGLPR